MSLIPFIILTGPLLIAVLPWRWTLRMTLAAGLVVLALKVSQPPVRHGGVADVVAFVLLGSAALLSAVALVIRGAVEAILIERRGPLPPGPDEPALQFASLALAAGSGVLGAFAIFIGLGWRMQGMDNGYLLHALVGATGAALVFVAILRIPDLVRAILVSFGLAIAALSTWGALIFPVNVRASAERLADEAPYCVALFDRSRPPQGREDLTFLTMEKQRWGHHAGLLVEGPEGLAGYHWSYRLRQFRPGLHDPRLGDLIPCIPRPDFFGTLAPSDVVEISWPGGPMRVPRTYTPRASGNSLYLAAAAPDFAPAPPEPMWINTGVSLGDANGLDSYFRNVDDTEPAPDAYGLSRRVGPGLNLHYRIGPDGSRDIVINCSPEDVRPGSCQHRFTRRGNIYFFRHPRDLLSDWRDMQDRFVALIAGFRVPD